MIEERVSPIHPMPSGLCEDAGGEATALIRRMAAGDGRALEELFAIWSPVFLGISTRMLGDPREAGKVVRDTFVKMWQRAGDFDPHPSPPFVWALAMLRDLAISRLRRRAGPSRRTPAAPQSEAAEDPQVMPPDDWRRLKAAMNTLSDEERACLENAVFLGYARAIAPDGVPAGTVKTCLRRALDKIRNPLSRYEL